MSPLLNFCLAIFVSVAVLAVGIGDAHAKRMGGGKSFGSKPSYSTPYQNQQSFNSGTPGNRSTSAQQNQLMRDSFTRRGGLMGFFGGLALGGLLGSLFLGGAFEHLNVIDLLLFAGVAYLLFKLWRARQYRDQPNLAAAGVQYRHSNSDSGRFGAGSSSGGENPVGPASRRFETDLMFGKGRTQSTGPRPDGFNEQHFLAGAASAYRMLQDAWDRAALSEIRGLTTDRVFSELQSQIKERDGISETRIIDLRTSLLSIGEENGSMLASVRFEAMLDESDGAPIHSVREVWHFIRPIQSTQPTWFLDGIQQVESGEN